MAHRIVNDDSVDRVSLQKLHSVGHSCICSPASNAINCRTRRGRYRDVRRRFQASPPLSRVTDVVGTAGRSSTALCRPPIVRPHRHMLSAGNIHLASGGPPHMPVPGPLSRCRNWRHCLPAWHSGTPSESIRWSAWPLALPRSLSVRLRRQRSAETM